jgi:putative transcriptional regulator
MFLSRGKFLVADRNIRDPRFAQTVLLLIDYSSQGAMGIIINRPTKVKLASAFPKIEALKKREDTIYIGGPVGVEQMFLLIRSVGTPGESLHVFADVSISSSERVLRAMAKSGKTGKSFRVYAGYAGWSPQQLDQEVMRGDWHVVQADSKIIFDKSPSEIWPELIRQSSKLWVHAGGRDATYCKDRDKTAPGAFLTLRNSIPFQN